MKRLFPHMTDSPERHQTLGALAYGVIPFAVLPFTLMLLIIGVDDTKPYILLEYLYQGISLAALLVIFRSYLQDSRLNVSVHSGGFWSVCLFSALAVCCIWAACALAGMAGLFGRGNLVLLGAMPVTGIELMLLPGDFILLGGIPAALFLTLAGPVITACLFYAPAFAPLCVSGRRVLAYIAVAVWLAVPRIITSCTIWGGWKELELYLAQLPIHLIACWGYQKTDSIWTPICTLVLANLFSCAALYILAFLGLIG